MALCRRVPTGQMPTQGLLRSQRFVDGLDAHFRWAQLFEHERAVDDEDSDCWDWEDDILMNLAQGKRRFFTYSGSWEQCQLWVQPIMNERRLHSVVVWTSGGVLLFAFTGGSCGAAAGAVVGAAVGTIPALLTFGLSIPVGIAAGGAIGGCAGIVASSSAGLAVGGICGGCCTAACLICDDPTASQEQHRQEAMPNARLQVAAASAAGGAVALGLSGGAVGWVGGGFFGRCCWHFACVLHVWNVNTHLCSGRQRCWFLLRLGRRWHNRTCEWWCSWLRRFHARRGLPSQIRPICRWQAS